MPISVLKLLSADEFRSGEEISQRLGLSRASVHNLVERARELGVEVHAVRGKGYRLAEPCSWLAGERLAAASQGGFNVLLHQEVDSTNSLLLGLAQQGQGHKSVLAAEWQSGGRGRRGRSWFSSLGGGLTFSLLWRFNRPLTALSGLSLAIGVALARGLRALGLVEVRVKWPNDILIDGRKLAGILIETHGDMLSAATAVIGIGINVKPRPLTPSPSPSRGPALRAQDATELRSRAERGMGRRPTEGDAAARERVAAGGLTFHDPLRLATMPHDYAAVAIEEVLGRQLDRNELLLRLLAELDDVLKAFDLYGFAPFRDEWQQLHVWQDKPVRVLGGGSAPIEGIALGVDEAGVLQVATADGVRAIHSGEVSLRAGGTG